MAKRSAEENDALCEHGAAGAMLVWVLLLMVDAAGQGYAGVVWCRAPTVGSTQPPITPKLSHPEKLDLVGGTGCLGPGAVGADSSVIVNREGRFAMFGNPDGDGGLDDVYLSFVDGSAIRTGLVAVRRACEPLGTPDDQQENDRV